MAENGGVYGALMAALEQMLSHSQLREQVIPVAHMVPLIKCFLLLSGSHLLPCSVLEFAHTYVHLHLICLSPTQPAVHHNMEEQT